MINNALDHSFDPIKGIIECFSTLKEGGILYLNHYKDEAEHENYRGFHQYNINCKNGQLLCWNKNNSVNISELLNGYAHVDITDLDDRVVAVIRKENDIEIEDFFPSEDDKRRFCIQIMYLISELLNWRITFTYSKNYFFLKIFHYISAKFSAEFKEKVKKLLKTK